ncbi:MAG: zinc ABC transporter solute-binding protein [Gammaproteobacteria bacterium]|uniref:High-affinity zinc uptake system protein ZnuA n=1 Tax=Marinobacter litoralis TaxID=187981 RepID=A0A3M2RKS4_9GAMM|nr:zinc ABC transporter substrate-binding protein [Marinobacter litoralis]MBR9870494.1 zinc ABC transporter solute-binding protein [Gammaproteobacteria bacterium]RMJ05937.1 High-affinity zinc uptake system protein ZnuA precursor [Marinobacter litoralis]
MNVSKTTLALGLAALVATTPVSATNIVASIKPIELVVKAVAGDNMNVSTIVPPGSSPHNYSMKPSQRRALEQADAIFWVGPDMETFLSRLLGGTEFAGKVVAFTEPSAKEAKTHHEHDNDHHHGHDHGDGEDPHLWVDPGMALEMARAVHTRLSTLDGINTAELDANLERFEQNLHKAEQTIKASLSQLDGTSLFAYHNAFERFAEHYELDLAGVLTLNPELSPGARHIAEVQSKLRKANQPCLLTEPQFNRQWWRSITEGLHVTVSTWDPLATDIESTANGYIEFQQSIADAALECLPK